MTTPQWTIDDEGDDVVQCWWCDGNHTCPADCNEGRVTDDG